VSQRRSGKSNTARGDGGEGAVFVSVSHCSEE
jgi:hypothetical protein